MNETSLSLLARVRQSDSDSWNRLVELYAPLMRRWLRTFDVSATDVEDLIQEVLVVVAQELPKFDHSARAGAFRSWLRKILVNRVRDYWRSRQRQPLAKGGTSLAEQLNQLEDESSQPSRIWNEDHDREVIARLMELVQARFQPRTWEAFRRQMFDGETAAQVAKTMDMSLGSVYMARSRVLAALRGEAEGLVASL